MLPKEIVGTCPGESVSPVVLSLKEKNTKDREGEVRKMVIQRMVIPLFCITKVIQNLKVSHGFVNFMTTIIILF